jgi:uncharacterized protein involved in response to NO
MIGEPSPTTGGGVHPFLAKGFRPFFLAAGLFAASILPIWMLALLGVIDPGVHLDAIGWHAHEMLFGFATAVIAGFLLTAVGNWTARETSTGVPLAGLAALWLAGRVAQLLPIPYVVVALVDLSFLPAVALSLAGPLVRAKNRRNYVMLAVLGALWVAEAMVFWPPLRHRGLVLGLDVVTLLIVVLAGRVFPMFTRNGTGVDSIQGKPWLDGLAIASVLGVAVADLAVPATPLAAALAALASVLVVVRAVTWGTRHTGRIPLLWILHAGYAFIPLGLALRAASILTPAVPPSSSTHALTVGAVGCITLGMMSRVALGHTGRDLVVGRPMIAAFGALVLAALVRVAGPFAAAAYRPSLFMSGVLWTLAFATFAAVFAPIVFAPRIDGKPG